MSTCLRHPGTIFIPRVYSRHDDLPVDPPRALAALHRLLGISALGAKRSIGNTAWWTQSLLRLGIVVLMRPIA
jgi:hypothetical protein